MISAIVKYAPSYWQDVNNEVDSQFSLSKYSEEYKQIEFEALNALRPNNRYSVIDIQRNQTVYDLGQFLIRGQLLIVADPEQTYYEKRMFLGIRKQYIRQALEYNIDPRRCGKGNQLVFSERVTSLDTESEYLLAVKVLVPNPNVSEFLPRNSSDYFLDYIIKLI